MLFGISISIGNEIMVGHLVGAKRFQDAFSRGVKSLKMGFFVTIGIVLVFWSLRHPILDALTEDKSIAELLLPLFLLSVFLEPGRTINIVMVNALRAAGDARFPLFTAIIFMWGSLFHWAISSGLKWKWVCSVFGSVSLPMNGYEGSPMLGAGARRNGKLNV